MAEPAARRWVAFLAVARAVGPARCFVATMAGGIALALFWSGTMEIDVIVRAEGRVIPAGKAQIVQHLEGGIVRTILVHEGQAVTEGQAVMELSDIRAQSDVGQERSQLDALLGREARLEAESSGRSAVAFPSALIERSVRQVELDAFRTRRERLQEEIGVLRNQGSQKRGEVKEAETRRENLGRELDLARRQLSVLEGLRGKGAASQLEVLETQARVQRLMSQLSETEASLPRLRAAGGEADAKAQETAARHRAEATAELAQVRAEIERLRHGLSAGADRLARSTVTAPVSGYVNRLNMNTLGGVVRPGDPILEITPGDARVAVEARVNPDDRANLRNGLRARVRVGAFDYATHGMLDGRVSEVSADTLTDEKGERYYRVRVEADGRTGLAPLPGMTAQADIVVGRRTILSYLLSPLLRFGDSAFRDPR